MKMVTFPGLYTVCALLICAVFILDLAIPLGVAVGVLYIFAVLVSLWAPKNRTTLIVAVLASTLIIAAFFSKPPVDEMWKVIFNRAISLFAVWITATLGIERKKTEQQKNAMLLEREKALEEVKILRGFLPICSSCKKIRDNLGDWTHIEGYIKDHSEAEFTHSICPECAEKLYPDFYTKQ